MSVYWDCDLIIKVIILDDIMLKTLHADMKLIAIIGEIYIHYI